MGTRLLLYIGVLINAVPILPMQALKQGRYSDRQDYHSYSNPGDVRVRHVALDLDVSFEIRQLRGSVTLTVERNKSERPLILDSRDLQILRVETSADGVAFEPAEHRVGSKDKVLGSPVTVQLPVKASQVRIRYETSPGATGLQWLEPAQTAGKKLPFLYSQSQAIHARSWIPLQDSPGVRVTYSARIRVPQGLAAVMSARNTPKPEKGGEYTFDMPQAIPPYLIALAVGELEYRAVSPRTGVYAEPSVVERAAKELDDTEKMMKAAERLYGTYRWEQYDILVLPPSFPFGGMENPRLTFATPTILAGDKSLVSLVAHELAHSWSGNLVTNATWRDFWLNEGFTTYFERRIQEEVYGRARSEMEALLEKQEVQEEMKTLSAKDQALYVDLKGRDPDEGFTQVPYAKGMLFLRRLEEVFGRDRFDVFLRGYFSQFAFQSIVTGDFVQYLQEHLFKANPALAAKINLEEWLTGTGLPPTVPQPKSDAFYTVSAIAKDWLSGKRAAQTLPVSTWSTQERLHFLRDITDRADASRMAELDKTFGFTKSGNSEVLFQWLIMAVRHKYEPASGRLEEFLLTVGRRKFIKPLYEELVKSAEGRARAQAVYTRARPGYHPIAQATIDDVLKPGANKPGGEATK